MKDDLGSLVFGAVVGFVAGCVFIVAGNNIFDETFEDGVIAAARGEYIATHVVLPDGSERWIVTKAKGEKP